MSIFDYYHVMWGLVMLAQEGACRLLSDEELLLKELFTDYLQSARPVINSSDTVPVSMQFSLMHLKELNVRSQVLTTTGLLIVKWVDERLTWDPADYNNLTHIIVEANRMWKPEFAIINGADTIYMNYKDFRAIVGHDGSVRWEPAGVFRTMCQIDITYYPFDAQNCSLTFGAWSYQTSKMNLTTSGTDVNLDSYKSNGEWAILATDVARKEFNYECCPGERYSNIAFRIYLRRRHTFYIMNIIVPSMLTSVLLLSIFFCTPGQKVQIGVVVLLSFRIFLLNVADNIPKTSDHVPLLGIYLTCTMAITTLSMVLTVFVLNLHHVGDRPVPRWLRQLMLVYFARLLAVSVAKDGATSAARWPRARRVVLHVDSDCVVDQLSRPGSDSESESEPEPEAVRAAQRGYAKEWRKVAEVFDRFFFWLFLLAITMTTLVLFHPLTDSCIKRWTNM